MKTTCGIWILIFIFLIPAHGQSHYLGLYLLFTDADKLAKEGRYLEARIDYAEGLHRLVAIRDRNPGWESALVGKKIDDCHLRLNKLEAEATRQAVLPSTRSTIDSLFENGVQLEASQEDESALHAFELCQMILELNQKHAPTWESNLVRDKLVQAQTKVDEVIKRMMGRKSPILEQ